MDLLVTYVPNIQTVQAGLEANEKAGVVYHREEINGDYDKFEDAEKLIEFIETGGRV